ncbi:hypothetical protein [Petrocella sp. FN5]|uniref:hypothetical protein n=1 Tax=Petrocella sp. FN5 TaxID=3032002 RepID=UPI0023DB3BD5|nr:hypothetical protein [Petrocella sp. FN5]MDF1618878.1 hypothetical protein [Petrocella sp. FN5]
MDLLGVIISGLFLFFIITGAVRVAIEPLVKSERSMKSVNVDKLYRFRDEGIISEQDISDYFDAVKGLKDYDEIRETFNDAKHVLKMLYESDVITSEDYNNRIEKLKSKYNME